MKKHYLLSAVLATAAALAVPCGAGAEGLPMPYNRSFSSSGGGISGMTVIDANNDGYTWGTGSNQAQCERPSTSAADDWLITPGLAMKGGRYYKVITPITAVSGDVVQAEIKIGTDPTVDGMTMEVMKPTDVADREDKVNYFKCPADGVYYIGIHSMTPADGALYTRVMKLTVDEIEPTAPGPVTDFTIAPASDGERPYKATISFKAPAVDMDGNPLPSTATVRVALYSGAAVIATTKQEKVWSSLSPGEEVSYTYSQTTMGNKFFAVSGRYNNKDGYTTYSDKVYIGVNKPGYPTDLAVTETENAGEVILSWKAPLDINGHEIKPDLLKYELYDSRRQATIATSVSGTSYTYQTDLTDSQDFFSFYICAETAGGKNPVFTQSPMVAVGKPLASPLTEGFDRPNGTMPLLYAEDNGYSSIMSEYDFSGKSKPESVEGDGYYLSFVGYRNGARPSATTGKISLSGLTSPSMAIDVFAPAADNGGNRLFGGNSLTIKVCEPGGEYKELGTVKINDLKNDSWNRIVYPLTEYAGKNVQFYLEGALDDFTSGDQSLVIADRLQVRENPAGTDMGILKFELPYIAEQSAPYELKVYIENDGATDIADAKVELYCNNELAEVFDIPALAAGAAEKVSFTQIKNALDNTENVYKAVVRADGDDNESNNASEEMPLNYKPMIHPAPEALAAVSEPDIVTLTWGAPALSGEKAEPVTESFEIEDKVAIDNFGDWIFYDLDKAPLGLPTGLVIDGLEEGKTHYAWIITDESVYDNDNYTAYEGTHFMSGFFNFDGSANNDFAVLPLLNGEAQTVTFYATSFTTAYPEYIDVWYSTGSCNVSDFKRLTDDYITVPAEWTKMTYELPEGTRYFAIRHCSKDAWVIGVDCVTYTPMEAGKDETLLGYNVYRDGELINDKPVEEATYADTEMEEGIHTYRVSAVYDKGESLACAPVEVEAKHASLAETFSGDIEIKGLKGECRVTADEALSVGVYSLDGIKVAAAESGDGQVSIALPSDLYVVIANGIAEKVAVK